MMNILYSGMFLSVFKFLFIFVFLRPEEEIMLDKRKQTLVQMIKILDYLECPQYLRRQLFPMQKHLQYAGLLNPLEATHHLKMHDKSPYREGIVLNKPCRKGSFVNVGLKQDCQVYRSIAPNVRVTVKIDNYHMDDLKRLTGVVVPPSEPREKLGLYWGYKIRMANSLHQVFDESPYKGGYDLKIGTSDRGDDVDKVIKTIPRNYQHLLVVFGGLGGIEAAHETDETLARVEDTKDLFDFYLNTCPDQGSDTIRTEVCYVFPCDSLILNILFVSFLLTGSHTNHAFISSQTIVFKKKKITFAVLESTPKSLFREQIEYVKVILSCSNKLFNCTFVHVPLNWILFESCSFFCYSVLS